MRTLKSFVRRQKWLKVVWSILAVIYLGMFAVWMYRIFTGQLTDPLMIVVYGALGVFLSVYKLIVGDEVDSIVWNGLVVVCSLFVLLTGIFLMFSAS